MIGVGIDRHDALAARLVATAALVLLTVSCGQASGASRPASKAPRATSAPATTVVTQPGPVVTRPGLTPSTLTVTTGSSEPVPRNKPSCAIALEFPPGFEEAPVTPIPVVTPDTIVPPADATTGLTGRIESLGRWRSTFQGPVTAIERATTSRGTVTYVASGRQVHILRDESGVLVPSDAVITTDCLIQAVHADGQKLGVVTVGGGEEGLYIYDISDPTGPRHLGNYPGEYLDVRLAGARAYLPAGARGLVVVDIGDPRRPAMVSRIDPGDHVRPRGKGVVDIRVDGNLLYVAALEAGLLIWDVSDPRSPKQIGKFQTPGYAEAVEVEGDVAYVSNNVVTPFTLWAIDIRDPGQPASLGKFQGETVSGGISQLRAAKNRLYYLIYNSGYVTSWRLGVVEFGNPVEFGDPPAPQLLGELSHHGFPWDLSVDDHTAYVADAEGVSVVAIAPDGTLREESRLIGTSPVEHMAVMDDHVFLFGNNGLHVVDASDPVAPVAAAHLDLQADEPIRVEGGVAYFTVGSGQGDLDLSNPSTPRWKDRDEGSAPGWCEGPVRLAVEAHCYRVAWIGGAVGVVADAYVAGELVAGLPVPLGAGPWVSRLPMAAYSHYVYVAGRDGMYVLDVSNPASPYLVALKPIENGTASQVSTALSTPGGLVTEYRFFGAHAIAISDGRAYVLNGGLWVFDLSDPTVPTEIAHYGTDAALVQVVEDRIYLAGPGSAVEVVRFAPATQ